MAGRLEGEEVTGLALAALALAVAILLAFLWGRARARDKATRRAVDLALRGNGAAARARTSGKTPEQIVRDNDGAW